MSRAGWIKVTSASHCRSFDDRAQAGSVFGTSKVPQKCYFILIRIHYCQSHWSTPAHSNHSKHRDCVFLSLFQFIPFLKVRAAVFWLRLPGPFDARFDACALPLRFQISCVFGPTPTCRPSPRLNQFAYLGSVGFLWTNVD